MLLIIVSLLLYLSTFVAAHDNRRLVSKECQGSAVFTADNIRDDEGSRYLIGIMGVLDSIGCKTIDVLVTSASSCKDVTCMMSLGTSQLVNWKNNRIKVQEVTVSVEAATIHAVGDPNNNFTGIYDTFVLFGTDKMPQFHGIGKGINFYVTQFGKNPRAPSF